METIYHNEIACRWKLCKNQSSKFVCVVPGPMAKFVYRRHLLSVQLLKNKITKIPVSYSVLSTSKRHKEIGDPHLEYILKSKQEGWTNWYVSVFKQSQRRMTYL